MSIVEPTGSRLERPAPVRHHSLRYDDLVLAKDIPAHRTSRAGTLGVEEAAASSDPEAVRRPFCALDEASYHLDSVSEPWSVHLEARLTGTVVEDRLRQAVGVALASHPRARARATIAHHRRAGYEWITPAPDVDPLDVVVCSDDDALQAVRADLQSLAVPLVTSPPLRIRLARHRNGDVVMLNLHHAAGDGIAALRFLRSLARAYAGAAKEGSLLAIVGARLYAPTYAARATNREHATADGGAGAAVRGTH